ncbi:murein biosynthesis integral membrane protein MurJ [Myxosarcina sp. GI1]|uniref:murein biosynthesis integral membrane protein MurJ n=1 Tax=Myxosarcina sp. GI1 TaxID=1541065 RepID=UPI000559D81D|nr:lipid II flippase MurJ [Myxosarcina sp. GI1]
MKLMQLQALAIYWNKLTSGSASRKIFGAAITVGLCTALVKLAAMAKELVIAWRFGTSDEVDAFLIAMVFSSLVINIIAESLAPAFIPVYIKVIEREGKRSAQKLLEGVSISSLILLLVATILMVAIAPLCLPFVASGFDSDKLQLTFYLLCAIAPFTFLTGISVIWRAVLNARERFSLASLSPIMIPLTTIVLLFVAKSWGMFALAGGLVFGTIFILIILAIPLLRQNVSLLPKWNGLDKNLHLIVVQYFPIAAGSLLICSTAPVDQTMAAMLPAGSVAALNYGHRLISSFVSLVSTAISAAVIPYFSKMIARQNWQEVNRTLRQYMRAIFLVTVPLALLFIIFSKPLVQLVFQRGSFTAEDTLIVSQIQSLYAIKIPFYLGDLLLLRVISTMSKNHILSWVSAFNLLVNIVLNYIFMQWIGVKGIALSTSCVYVFSFLILGVFVSRQLKKYEQI